MIVKYSSYILLTLFVLLLLVGCLSKEGVTKPTVIEEIYYNETPLPHYDFTILDLYNTWQGNLVCNNRTYSPNDVIYYSDQLLECYIPLTFDPQLNVTSQQLKTLQEQYITAAEPWHDYAFVNLMTNAQTPNLLTFHLNPPEHPLTLLFTKEQSEENYAFHFHRSTAFTYEVLSAFDIENEIMEIGTRYYLKTGEHHHFSISFSTAVNKEKTEQQLDNLLSGLEKDIKWGSDRNLHLTLKLKPGDEMARYDSYSFFFDDSIAESEQAETSHPKTMRFQPAALKEYRIVDTWTRKQDIVFSTLISYSALELSPNGQWILAEELLNRESILIPEYSLLNREGKRVKRLNMDTPQWLADGQSLLYKNDNMVIHYNVETGEERVLWQSERDVSAHIQFNINQYTGKLTIFDGKENESSKYYYNLYYFNSVEAGDPLMFNQFFHDEIGMNWDGLHYQTPVYDIGNGYIYYEHDVAEQAVEHYVMNVFSGQKSQLSLEDYEQAFPLQKGKLLKVQDSKFIIYDAEKQAETGITLELPEVHWLQVKTLSETEFLLLFSNSERSFIYILDIDSYKLTPYEYEGQPLLSGIWNGLSFTSK